MKKKVLQLIHGFSMGGAETLVKEYCIKLNKEKYDVSVLCFFRYNTPYEKILEDAGIKITYINDYSEVCSREGSSKGKRICMLLKRYLFIRNYIRKEAPDILHTHLALNNYVLFANPKKGTKILHTVHNEPKVLWDTRKERRIDFYSVKQLVKKYKMQFITLHDQMRAEINEMFGVSDSVVLNNGIDFSRYENVLSKEQIRAQEDIPQDAFVVGHVGRFGEQKNHKFLVEVFEEIHKKNPKAFLLMIGNGKLQEEIEQLLSRKGLEKHYKILSKRTDIPDLMNAMDRFVFPSVFEGLGIVLIEAQKAGVACVASDAVPKAAVVSNYVKQLDLKLSAEAWAAQVIEWNPGQFKSYGLEDWDMKKVVLCLESFYDSESNVQKGY